MTLREANRGFAERLANMRGVEHVHDERSAQRMGEALCDIGRDGFTFMRTEYAKKRSNIMYSGFEIRTTEDKQDLSVLSILSSKGRMYCGWLKFKVALHALERVQQRRIGVATRLSDFADEFAPALIAAYAEGVARGTDAKFATGEFLIATSTGALISVYDQEWKGRIGVTWLAMEQLRPEQIGERILSHKLGCGWLMLLANEERKERQSFAGRNDRIVIRTRDTARSISPTTPA